MTKLIEIERKCVIDLAKKFKIEKQISEFLDVKFALIEESIQSIEYEKKKLCNLMKV